MSSIGIFRLFGAAMLFIVWAAQMVSVASTHNPDDPIYNAAIAVPFVERAADKYVGDCLSYAWVKAYDDFHPNAATAIQQSEVNSYFDSCINTAFSRLKSIDYVKSVSVVGAVNVVRNDWNYWTISPINVRIEFNFPLSVLGYSDDIVVDYQIWSDKNMVIYDTGFTVIETGRPQYRIVVWNKKTGEVEVNGLWPR